MNNPNWGGNATPEDCNELNQNLELRGRMLQILDE